MKRPQKGGRIVRATPLFLVPLVLAFARIAGAATYYVSPSGSDKKNGTSPSSAWKTIKKVNSFTFRPGDGVLFQGGKSFSGNVVFTSADAGTSTAPVTVSSYGTGRATINAGSGTAIRVTDADGFVLSNLNLRGVGYASGNHANGISVETGLVGRRSMIRIDQVDAAGFLRGILVQGYRTDSQITGFNDVRITNCVTHDVEGYGIIFWSSSYRGSSNLYVGHCTAYNIPGHTALAAAGISIQNCQTALVERSVAYNVGANSDIGPAGFSVLDADNVTVQYCESYQNKKPAGKPDGDGIDVDGGVTNSVVQYCYMHDNQGPGLTLTQYAGGLGTLVGNVVRYNVLENNGLSGQGEGGIQIWGASATYHVDANQVYNNTVYTGDVPNNHQLGVLAMGCHANVTLRNNVFINKSGSPLATYDSPGGVLCQGNVYWSQAGGLSLSWYGKTYTTLAAWRIAAGQERLNGADTGMNVDPMLNAPGAGGTIGDPDKIETLTAYRLRTGSPLIDNGLHLRGRFGIDPGTADLGGAMAPQGPGYDVGACETPAVCPLPDGNYRIVNVSTGKALTVPGTGDVPVQQQAYAAQANQRWALSHVIGGQCDVTSVAEGNAVDNYGASLKPGSAIHACPASGAWNQQWALKPLGGGQFALLNLWSGMALDAAYTAPDGSAAGQAFYTGNATQKWTLAAP